MEILLSVEIKDSIAIPIQINIVYDNDGEIESVDWRHALPDIIQIDLENLENYNSDSDEDYVPDYDNGESDALEYTSDEA